MPFVYIIGTGGGEGMNKENLTSQVNGLRTEFTVTGNFVRQVQGEHFTEVTDQTFTSTVTPQNGDFLNIEYISK